MANGKRALNKSIITSQTIPQKNIKTLVYKNNLILPKKIEYFINNEIILNINTLLNGRF